MKTQAYLLVFVQFVLLALLAAAFFFLPNGQVLWARLLGIAVLLLGLVVFGLALLTHFQVNHGLVNVSPEPNANNHLVRVGVYTRVRHPIYSAVMLGALGAAIAHGHLTVVIVAVLLCAFFTYKSTFEERWLAQVYPDYTDYRTRAGRFWPKF